MADETTNSRLNLHAWARFAAKCVDTSIYGTAVIFSVGMIIEVVNPYGETWGAAPSTIAILLLFLGFPFWDAFLIWRAGTSPGRVIFRFRVLSKSDDQNPSEVVAVRRAWGSWWYGLGLGLPIISVVTSLMSKDYLERYGESRWDKMCETHVVHRGPEWWSWLCVAAPAVVLFLVALNDF